MKDVLDEYAARFAKFGDCAEGHGWGNELSEVHRRTALLTVFGGVKRPFTALDFGCGSGDFSLDLVRCGMTEYVGVEVVPAIRNWAQQRFPQHQFVEKVPEGMWDYVFVSGTFNLKASVLEVGWETWVREQVRLLRSCARKALAMNFLTYRPDWREPDLWYPDSPDQIVEWAQPAGYHVIENYGLRGEWTLLMTT